MRSALLLLATTCTVYGCDAQAPKDYEGEPLLSLQVSLDLTDHETTPSGQLVPALAFHSNGRLDIMDVDVTGSFPGNFKLEVRGLPPETALMKMFPTEGEPSIARAYIAAADANHADFIKVMWGGSSGPGPGGCTENACEIVETWCASAPNEPSASQDCFTETLACDREGENCTLTKEEGDREIKYGFEETFAGLSANYVIIYAPDGVEANSLTADTLGASEGLSAGYHLFETHEPTSAEQARHLECVHRVNDAVIDEFNETFGSNYESITGFSTGCTLQDTAKKCAPTDLMDEFDAIDARLGTAARCWTELNQHAPVENPEETDLSIVISGDLSKFGLTPPELHSRAR